MTAAQSPPIDELIGATITAIQWSPDTLIFDTDKGDIAYTVIGDCCSHSYFHDFFGVANLLTGSPVTGFEAINLSPGDPGHPDTVYDNDADASQAYHALQPAADPCDDTVIQVYGFRITTEHPLLGPVSSVVAFRNVSNGYYGGWMERLTDISDEARAACRQITSDVLGD